MSYDERDGRVVHEGFLISLWQSSFIVFATLLMKWKRRRFQPGKILLSRLRSHSLHVHWCGVPALSVLVLTAHGLWATAAVSILLYYFLDEEAGPRFRKRPKRAWKSIWIALKSCMEGRHMREVTLGMIQLRVSWDVPLQPQSVGDVPYNRTHSIELISSCGCQGCTEIIVLRRPA